MYIGFNKVYIRDIKLDCFTRDLQVYSLLYTSNARSNRPPSLATGGREKKTEIFKMAHHYRKKWVFTWNAEDDGTKPSPEALMEFLNSITKEGVFQLEVGKKSHREHYQGRFELNRPRMPKKKLLELFTDAGFDIKNLTVEPEIVYNSERYCTKDEGRVSGPYRVGTQSYREEFLLETLQLRQWQKQLIKELRETDRSRTVFWVQDPKGGSGKSTFLKYLCFGNNEFKTKKLPIDKPDRIRMGVCQIVKNENVDMFAFDFTRTMGEDSSMKDLFQIIEEIKNGHVVSVMYGKYQQVVMTPPHVIIFTNEKFEDYRKYLSADRWAPYAIAPTGDRELMHMVPSSEGLYENYTPVEYKKK